jgi:putative CocE/NonD family hydrolase
LYLRGGGKVSFEPPAAGEDAYGEYVSDPARPVPYRQRPIQPGWFDGGKGWSQWLVEDQRWASGRTDVLTYTSDVLTEPLKISGIPAVNLVASTSGTDSDWIVKLIDVYPDEYQGKPQMGGYQLMVAADAFRGRYYESLEFPRALEPGKPTTFRFDLPAANHVFMPGHRIMVQVQSSWFPLYDRNPQTFVPNIFWARPEDYKQAVQRVYHAGGMESYLELPLESLK